MRPDGLPVPGTDTCRPPRERIWQLTPQQLARHLHHHIPHLERAELEARFALYATAGSPYTADPTILNGSPQWTTEVFGAVRELGRRGWVGLFDDDGHCAGLDAEACTGLLIDERVPRIWGRPLGDDERDALERFVETARRSGGDDHAGGLLLRRVLMAPDVLFRRERGTLDPATGVAHLSAYEIAAQIAYTLSDGPPDDALWAAAQDGSLSRPEVIADHVRRLLERQPELDEVALPTDRAARQVRGLMRFFREWLDVEMIRASLRSELPNKTGGRILRWLDNETMLFLRHALWRDDARLATLLAADYTVYSNTLNDYYGHDARDSGLSQGDPLPTRDGRRGLLMQAGFLTSHDTTSRRGAFLRARLFCQTVEVPADVDNNIDGIEETLEEQEGVDLAPREVRDRHMNDPTCSGCHGLIDPLGYPFDAFDAVGRPRNTWDGFAIDTAGAIVGTARSDTDVADAAAMAVALSTSRDVHDCFVEQLFAYVHGRQPSASDGCYLDHLKRGFEASGGDVRELMVDMMTGEEMRTRTPLYDEMTQQ